jgi:chromosome segregation ATPase
MTSPATRLLEKRRQLYEVSEAFEMQKRRSETEEALFDKKEKEIRDRDIQLQHQLVRFNKFLQDNEAKRKRAEHRANEEVKEIRAKDDEITALQFSLENLKKSKLALQTELSQVSCYQEFLESVLVAESATFKEIPELVARHATLVAAHRDLLASQRRLEIQNENFRDQIITLRKQKTTELMALSNEAAVLLSSLEDVEKRRRTLEYQAETVAARDAEQTEIVGGIFRSIDNIFSRVVSQRPLIQHAAELPVATTPANLDESVFFTQRTADCVARLHCLEAYARDLKDVADLARREIKAAKVAKAARPDSTSKLLDGERIPEPEFVKQHAALMTHADVGSKTDTAANTTKSLN